MELTSTDLIVKETDNVVLWYMDSSSAITVTVFVEDAFGHKKPKIKSRKASTFVDAFLVNNFMITILKLLILLQEQLCL